MIKKYSKKRYEDFGLFISYSRRGDGYKIIRDEDGWIFDKLYTDKQAAQNWIDEMIERIDNSKVKWI